MKAPPVHLATLGGALLGFLTMAVVGWNLADAPESAAKESISSEPKSRRAGRDMGRSKPSGPGSLARKELDSIRSAGSQEARLSATFALANSLAPSEIAAWLDNGWFNIRGGPERLLFRNILFARWRETDPEGLLVWSLKNDISAAQVVLGAWAEKEPQRLLDYFKSHPNEVEELRSLRTVAKTHPGLALQRLQEMAAAGMSSNGMGNSFSVFRQLAENSPAALEAILDSLPLLLRNQAESALCGEQLVASFSTEIRALWERPNGWKIFEANLSHNPELRGKLFDELANLPPAWRSSVAESYYHFIQGEQARKWLDVDLESLGFTAAQSKKLRSNALEGLARENPEEAIQRLSGMELSGNARQNLISNLFSSLEDDPGKAEALIARLASEEDRKFARDSLEARKLNQAGAQAENPAEWLEKVSGMNSKSDKNSYLVFRLVDQWDVGKIAELNRQFTALPDDKKQTAAQAIAAGRRYGDSISPVLGEAIRHLVVNPVVRPEGQENSDSDPLRMASEYAAKLAIKDPAAASEWVGSLPAGDTKLWAQKNVAKNWAVYDPKAAEQWVAALPVEARNEVSTFMKKEK